MTLNMDKIKNMENGIYIKNHLNQWFYIDEELEPLFNSLLEDYILTGKSSKFLKEFKDFRITSREEHKKSQLNK